MLNISFLPIFSSVRAAPRPAACSPGCTTARGRHPGLHLSLRSAPRLHLGSTSRGPVTQFLEHLVIRHPRTDLVDTLALGTVNGCRIFPMCRSIKVDFENQKIWEGATVGSVVTCQMSIVTGHLIFFFLQQSC